MPEMSVVDNDGSVGGPVALTGNVKTLDTHALEDAGPFLNLQGNTIFPCDSGRDKRDAFALKPDMFLPISHCHDSRVLVVQEIDYNRAL